MGHRRSPANQTRTDALEAACRNRRPARPVIFHSGRGGQCTSHELAALATQFEIRLSVGRTGECPDNVLAESFFSTLKNELGDTHPWPTRTAAHTAIFEWIESWYNVHRRHSALGYRSPPNMRPPSQPNHHTKGVRQSGTSSTDDPARVGIGVALLHKLGADVANPQPSSAREVGGTS
ncbi:transposase [Streptomyces sp. NPDC055085]